ncbi:LysR family transcriptional regulator [Burkholderia glumae]|uniref:LysR family transcriptional regulator n=1 Tax=Burkholderia glumae TaxID=337 RepID=UPI0005C296AD|nr:LysR family transcriptional regulator [Burkholderia glumae]MCM2491684.1 LysR family transcriptional regulator [Burkholderia glumae]MCM2542672.1 LysR family transcriptional regulator [Burkholderia glumae]MCQ0033136.1 LysR family transcriptional regulator [Burkholderia glumae]MCQ0038169.1 LysR family transcriptional regulator [Burkholderia glumae]RQZ66175.1 LysR family transcriptional regulator [Burkholderia glumae]
MNAMNIADVDLNLLKVFEVLFDEGGASRAAIRLDLTQSAVSAALRRLRALYGDPLFVRTGRGLAPTARARELKPLIGEALDRCRQSLAFGAPAPASFEGRAVSVAMSDDFEIAFGGRLIECAARLAPGLRVIFRQTHSQIVGDALANREVDLAIAAGGFATRGLGHMALGHGRYACLVDPAAAPDRLVLTLDDFLAREHVLVSSGGVVGIVDEALAEIGRRRTVRASTTHFAALSFLLRGTPAVATIPHHAAEALARMTGLGLVACPLAMPAYPVALGWRVSTLRDAAVAKLRQAIVDSFAGFAAAGLAGGRP